MHHCVFTSLEVSAPFHDNEVHHDGKFTDFNSAW